MKSVVVPISRFREVFERLNWKKTDTNNQYEKWVSMHDSSMWTVLPLNDSSPEYQFYQSKNIKLLLYFLDIDETTNNYDELFSQLLSYNYKLINKINYDESSESNSVPYDLANLLSEKNINSFRTYYINKTKENIPIEKFELNHTQRGSFIIPISIAVDVEQEALPSVPTKTNHILREYLDTIDNLIKIKARNENDFVNKVFEIGVDSKIVKNFLSETQGIIKYKNRYGKNIKDVEITSQQNYILDYGIPRSDRLFTKVHIGEGSSIPENYIELLEKKEVEEDAATIEAEGAKIDVVVDAIDVNGTAKFTIQSVNNEPVQRPYKARTHKLTKKWRDFCANGIISGDLIEITGDIIKARGKVGELAVDGMVVKQSTPTLFDQDTRD